METVSFSLAQGADATTDESQIRAWWEKWPEANVGIATGSRSGIVVLDIDSYNGGDESFKKLVEAVGGNLPPTLTAATGGGGSHLFFSTDVGSTEFKNATKFVGLLGIDVRGEGGYVVGAPSLHIKGKRYEWVGDFNSLLAPAPAWLRKPQLLKSSLEGPVTAQVNGEQKTNVVGILESMGSGNRNDSFARVAGKLHQGGMSPEDIEAVLLPWAQSAGTSLAELQGVIRSISRYARRPSHSFQASDLGLETETKGPIKVRTLVGFLGEAIADTPWLVNGVIPAMGIGLIAGQENLGKTWLALDLALSVATGRPWLGQHTTKKSKVLFIDEEGVPYFQQWRLKGMTKFGGFDPAEVSLDLVLNEDISLLNGTALQRLMQAMEVSRPELVIIDSLVRVFGGDENSSQAVSQLFRVIKQLNLKYECSTVLNDHHRKGEPGSSGWNQMVRGSSDKMAAVDFAFAVTKEDDELVLYNTKARYAERLKPFKVKLERQDDGHVVVVYNGLAEDKKGEDPVLALSPVLDKLFSDNEAVSRRDIVDAAKGHGVTEKETDAALRTMVKQNLLSFSTEKPEGGKGNLKHIYRREDYGEKAV